MKCAQPSLNHGVAEEGRRRIAVAHQINGKVNKGLRRPCVPANPHRRVDHARPAQGFETQNRQCIGDVFAFSVAPPHHHRHRKTIGHIGIHSDVEVLDIDKRTLPSENATREICLVERPECSIEMSRDNQPGTIGIHHANQDEPEKLDRLQERGRGTVSDSAACVG